MMSAGMNTELPLIGPIPPSASAVPTATPRITGGKDQINCMSGLRSASTTPRKNPQSKPTKVPKMMMIAVAMAPMYSEVRPP